VNQTKLKVVKLLVIVNIDFKRYPGTYWLLQGRCFICKNY